MSKIGFFGGSFNPPTNAHINLAKQIINECNLDKLIFVPIGDFYQKNELICFKYRYDMLDMICNLNEKLEVSDIEKDKNMKLYAINIFKIIKEKYEKDNLYYVMGSDNLKNIKNWKGYNELIKDYKYIILERQKDDFKQIIKKNFDIKSNIDNFTVISNENYMNVSSSLVREKIKKNEKVSKLIPKEIEKYIYQHNLYVDIRKT